MVRLRRSRTSFQFGRARCTSVRIQSSCSWMLCSSSPLSWTSADATWKQSIYVTFHLEKPDVVSPQICFYWIHRRHRIQPIEPATVSWSPTKVVVSCVQSYQRRALWDEHTATMDTGVLQPQVRSCGVAYQLNCNKLTLSFNDLSGY